MTAAVVESWELQAACRTPDGVDAHDLAAEHPTSARATEFARTYCRPCPVRVECLRAATGRDERHGVWGGLTTTQRDMVRVHGWVTCAGCRREFAPMRVNQKFCAAKCHRLVKAQKEGVRRV